MTTFLHTADWHVGKPFAQVEDPDKRACLRLERIEVIQRIAALAREHRAEFVLVAGDLFDGTTPDRAIVSAACGAIGRIDLPIFVIPGNHDHGGPGTVWDQEFFQREQEHLAPNLRVLARPEPVEACGVVLLPCPLGRRQESADATAWLRDPAVLEALPRDRPRVVLAHGSTQSFDTVADKDDTRDQPNRIALGKLPVDALDYIALGDWHGTKQVGPGAWYSGTPELDRFVKGGGHAPGHVLRVHLPARGAAPEVLPLPTARFGWHAETFRLTGDTGLDDLEARLATLLGGRTREDLLDLTLEGTLGFEGEQRLRDILDRLDARLLRLKRENRLQVSPSDQEIAQLLHRPVDPLVAAVATRLHESSGTPDSALATRALRELHRIVAACGAPE